MWHWFSFFAAGTGIGRRPSCARLTVTLKEKEKKLFIVRAAGNRFDQNNLYYLVATRTHSKT